MTNLSSPREGRRLSATEFAGLPGFPPRRRPRKTAVPARLLVLLSGLLLLAATDGRAAQNGACGLRIEDTPSAASLQPGDLLLSFEGTAWAGTVQERGELHLPFAWDLLLLEADGYEKTAWEVVRDGRRVRVDGAPADGRARVGLAAARPECAFDPALAGAWRRHREALSERRARRWAEALRQRRGIEEIDALPTAVAAFLWREKGWDAEEAGDLAAAERFYRRAVARWRTARPESLPLADAEHLLGTLLFHRSALDEAEAHLRRALAIRRALAPGTVALGKSLNNLGLVQRERGYMREAGDLLRESLAIKERWEPGSFGLAQALNSMGAWAYDRGDLSAAEEYFRRSITLRRELTPDSPALSLGLNNLAAVVQFRGDLEQAETWYRQALEIARRKAPGSRRVAVGLDNLSQVATLRGDHERAVALAREAAAIYEARLSRTTLAARGFQLLAQAELRAGDREAAREAARRALEIYRTSRSRGMEAARAEEIMGKIALAEDRAEEARRRHLEALEIRRRLAPGSHWEARSLRHLAAVDEHRGAPDSALELYARALRLVEELPDRPGETPGQRAAAYAEFVSWYRRAAELQVDAGRAERAFELLERSRARGFLTMLAARDPVLDRELPAAVEAERRRLANAYERTLEGLSVLDVEDAATYTERLERLSELRDARRQLARRVRRLSPRAAALRDPPAASFHEIERQLEARTLLVAYAVGDERTLLFGLARGEPLMTASVPLGKLALYRRIETLRLLLSSPSESGLASLRAHGAELYELLLSPFEALRAGRRRIVIVADGPLHWLPFAALVAPDGRWLAEHQSVIHTPSATVLARLRGETERRETGRGAGSATPLSFVGLADPRTQPSSAPARAADVALPKSRDEVRAAARLFSRSAELFVGSEATETRAKIEGSRAAVLHFAAHGQVNERFPLDSYLALAPTETDNGLLYAWEVIEEMNTDAQLVTLSGCETALGRELDGEGLVGLSWAFFHAGARAVVASQWRVDDAATAALMIRFYDELSRNDKGEALRLAQLHLASGAATLSETPLLERLRRLWDLGAATGARDYAHPFYWSGFQLLGDWRALETSAHEPF